MSGLRVYIIAGEPSGDRLGGALMEGLKTLGSVTFRGVGGRDMAASGLSSQFDMAELTVMGLSEVLPKLPHLMRRIRETSEDVIAQKPDALITIDSPDFTLRVAKRARRALPDLKVIHYVAPSVWAWRPGRAAKMARYVDHVLALLPFEPPYMQAAGMTCDFVGHPVVAHPVPSAADILDFRARIGLKTGQKALLLAPGSRKGEVRRLGGDFAKTVARLRMDDPDLMVICPAAETVRFEVETLLSGIGGPVYVVLPEASDDKPLAFAAADAALCASGTVTLELAACNTPMVAAYRTTWLTAQIVRRVVKVDTANLINLVSGEDVVPEFLQERCTVDALAAALSPLLNDPTAGNRQREIFGVVMADLGRGGELPGLRAARSVLAALDRSKLV